MPGGFWWEEVRGTCGGVELVPWGLRFASVGRGSGQVEGQSHGETRCILNLDKSSKKEAHVGLHREKLFCPRISLLFIFPESSHAKTALYTQRTGLSEGPTYRITNAWPGFVYRMYLSSSSSSQTAPEQLEATPDFIVRRIAHSYPLSNSSVS